jgi:hypothetical protein
MAGTIEVRPDVLWSTSGWMFDFVIRSISAEVTDQALKHRLSEIEENNLGWLSLPQLPEPQRAQVETAIRERLIMRAEQDLPQDMNQRAGVVRYVQGLADVLAGMPLDQAPGHAGRRSGST